MCGGCCAKLKPYKCRSVLFLAFAFDMIGLGFGIWTIVKYWNERERTLAVVATVSLSLGGAVSVFYVPYLGYLFYKNETDIDKPSSIMRYLKLTLQSIPQVTIALYLMSICDISSSVLDWMSLVWSFVSTVFNSVLVDEYYHQERQMAFFDCGEEARKKWVIFMFSMVLNMLGLFVRVLVLVYFTFQLGFWIALVLVLHWFGFSLILCSRNSSGESDFTGLAKCVCVSFSSVFESLFYTFLWSETKTALDDLLMTVWYVVENLTLVVIAYFARRDEFCFTGAHTTVLQDLWIHIGLNVGILVIGAIFCLYRRTQENADAANDTQRNNRPTSSV